MCVCVLRFGTVSRLSSKMTSKAAVEELAVLRVPVLREVDELSVVEFVKAYELYQAQGGKRRPRDLMGSGQRWKSWVRGSRMTSPDRR